MAYANWVMAVGWRRMRGVTKRRPSKGENLRKLELFARNMALLLPGIPRLVKKSRAAKTVD